MNRREHLLTILSEECAEVAKEVSKANRFGLDDHQPGQPETETNRKKLTEELNDLVAIADMLFDEGYIDDFLDIDKMESKKKKVEKYLKYSKEKGTLKED
jgi:NTP pyrophosphatase (non-canonical NTP hydrolase)